MAENQPLPPDPIRTKSLSRPIFVATALLMLATFGALYDEFVHKRPYEAMQREWIEKFSAHLDKVTPVAEEKEALIRGSDAYKALDKAVVDAEAAAAARLGELDKRSADIVAMLASMDFGFRDRKGRIDEFVNKIENAHDEDDKNKLRAQLAAFREKPITVKLELPGGVETKDYTTTTLIDTYLGLKAEQGRISGEKGTLLGPVSATRRTRDAYFEKNMGSTLSAAKLDGLRNEIATFTTGVKQIFVKEMGELVDRCESCHLGIRKPLEITAEDIGNPAFTSHPRPELLQVHDPEKFGCSPCHNGNGIALVSTDKAHGRYKHWLWPLYHRENMEAGCVQCHTKDITLHGADTFNKGRELYNWRGCWGCHRYEGYDAESEEFALVRKDLMDIRVKKEKVDEKLNLLPTRRAALADMDEDKASAEGTRINQEEKDLTQQMSGLETARIVREQRSKDLLSEIKKVGPSLKEVKMKLKPEWLPVWIKAPTAFRPDTKMPQYETLDDAQVKAISAYVWAKGVTGPAKQYKQGDAERGKQLLTDRGCYACHGMGEGDKREGGNWAANLSRIGEKTNYDYLVRWLLNPKERTLPYSIDAKRDLTPEDFAKKGLPFEFNDDTPCPITGGPMLAHQMTKMPNLRLSVDDAQDMATHLMTKKHADATYAAVDWMTNASPDLIKQGEELIKTYGCAGCHEIGGLENEGRIGAELTYEGSKPMERLDFGHLTHTAKMEKWYNHKGYFEHKLENPQVFNFGKELTSPLQGQKMPNFHLSTPAKPRKGEKVDDITALTTFLLGSVESLVPKAYRDLPANDRAAIKEGWWLVQKYNCNGCHQFLPESDPSKLPILWQQKWFSPEGENMETWTSATGEVHKPGAVMRPPTLVGQGARVDPQWLAEFLRNPALSKTKVHRNGVRGYLNVRMPTYNLSEGEIAKFVRFFQALAKQPTPYVRPEQVPLTEEETEAAWAVFAANDCAKCHAQGEVLTPQINAPSFTLSPSRLRPNWMHRWIVDPTSLIPETAMPKGLFVREAGTGRWITAKNPAEWPSILKQYKGDHADLIVRLLAQYNAIPQPVVKK